MGWKINIGGIKFGSDEINAIKAAKNAFDNRDEIKEQIQDEFDRAEYDNMQPGEVRVEGNPVVLLIVGFVMFIISLILFCVNEIPIFAPLFVLLFAILLIAMGIMVLRKESKDDF